MAEGDDLVRADMWASMSFRPGLPDEELRRKFRDFSLRADKMLLEDWKKYAEEQNDERMRQICKILTDVIFEKEHPMAKKILSGLLNT